MRLKRDESRGNTVAVSFAFTFLGAATGLGCTESLTGFGFAAGMATVVVDGGVDAVLIAVES